MILLSISACGANIGWTTGYTSTYIAKLAQKEAIKVVTGSSGGSIVATFATLELIHNNGEWVDTLLDTIHTLEKEHIFKSIKRTFSDHFIESCAKSIVPGLELPLFVTTEPLYALLDKTITDTVWKDLKESQIVLGCCATSLSTRSMVLIGNKHSATREAFLQGLVASTANPLCVQSVPVLLPDGSHDLMCDGGISTYLPIHAGLEIIPKGTEVNAVSILAHSKPPVVEKRKHYSVSYTLEGVYETLVSTVVRCDLAMAKQALHKKRLASLQVCSPSTPLGIGKFTSEYMRKTIKQGMIDALIPETVQMFGIPQ